MVGGICRQCVMGWAMVTSIGMKLALGSRAGGMAAADLTVRQIVPTVSAVEPGLDPIRAQGLVLEYCCRIEPISSGGYDHAA